MPDPIVKYSLDDYFQASSIGSVDRAIGNNLYGINHRQTPGLVPSNKDSYGLIFMVRPQLNLQPDNVRNDRRFFPLLNRLDTSMQRYVRTMLDPRLQRGYTFRQNTVAPMECPIVDPFNPFIPIMTNNATSSSGWPDMTTPIFTSKPGLINESYIQVDGKSTNAEAFDVDVSFRNTHGDPILYMLYIWMHYNSNVFQGTMLPYMDYIAENTIDYNSRIYRLVLDRYKNKVTKIGSTGPAIPVSNPIGGFFDLNVEKPYNDQTKDISVRFHCSIFESMDDILMDEFNKTVMIFNPNMRDQNRENTMAKIGRSFLRLFNNRGYARIDPETRELEWWIDKDFYQQRLSEFAGLGILDTTVEDQLFTGD